MIKRVYIYTYGDLDHKTTIQIAARFAKSYSAKLYGLFVRPDLLGYNSGAFSEMALPLYKAELEYEERNKQLLEEIAVKNNCDYEWHQVNEFEQMSHPALYADIVFITQPSGDSKALFNHDYFVDQFITESGLPTVVVPIEWASDTFAKKPVLGWKETPEAVNAVRHTLDLMRDAENVDVVTVTKSNKDLKNRVNGIEICKYLSEHNIACEFFETVKDKKHDKEPDLLLQHTLNRDRDLIMIGGHSRLRSGEIIMGNMTKSLVRRSPLPVLIVH